MKQWQVMILLGTVMASCSAPRSRAVQAKGPVQVLESLEVSAQITANGTRIRVLRDPSSQERPRRRCGPNTID